MIKNTIKKFFRLANVVLDNKQHLQFPGEIVLNSLYKKSSYVKFINISDSTVLLLRFPIFIAMAKQSLGFLCLFFYDKWLKHFNAAVFLAFKVFKNAVYKLMFTQYNIVQFVGFRNRQRWFRYSQVMRYKIGYNKRVWIKCPDDFITVTRKISPKKRTHLYLSKQVDLLRLVVYSLYLARPATIYKGRGINLKEQPLVLKEGKKTLW